MERKILTRHLKFAIEQVVIFHNHYQQTCKPVYYECMHDYFERYNEIVNIMNDFGLITDEQRQQMHNSFFKWMIHFN